MPIKKGRGEKPKEFLEKVWKLTSFWELVGQTIESEPLEFKSLDKGNSFKKDGVSTSLSLEHKLLSSSC